jgi:hypothetical protein
MPPARCSPLLVSLAVVVVSLVSVSPARACDCAGMPICASFWSADLAFVGSVKDIASPVPGREETTFVIEEWLRGEAVKTSVTIVSNGVGYSCDYDFKPSTSYLVLAYKAADGSWKASLCGGTAPLDSRYGRTAVKEIRESLTSRQPGQVSGSVAFDEDPTERVMPGEAIVRAVVRLQNVRNALTTRTDERGEFRFLRVPPGRYSLSVDLPPNAKEIPPAAIVVGAKACVQRYIHPHRRQ